MTSLDEVLLRGVDKVYPDTQSLKKVLDSNKKLKIYFGIDPTSPNIHIGHSIPLRKLRQFQDLGHKIVLLFGDFTAMIGDPSEKSSQRTPLKREQVEQNFAKYKHQAAKILSFEKNAPEIEYNSKWWDKMTQSDFFNILSKFTVSQLIERSMFQERIKGGKPIAVSEFLYPILQGFDSVAMDVDMEIGATDQTFNMLTGRHLLSKEKSKEKFVLTTPLLRGTDGRKMSKSYGNTIDISDTTDQMYGKTMSLKDELIIEYFELVTNVDSNEIQEIDTKLKGKSLNPMEAKKRLAFELVNIYHSEDKAKDAEKEFESVYQKGNRTTNIEESPQQRSLNPISYASLATLSGGTVSISEAVRLSENDGLRFDGKLVSNPRENIPEPDKETIIDIGKRRSIRVIWKDK